MYLKVTRWILTAFAAPIAVLVLMTVGSTPSAFAGEPTGEFAVFKECPFENPAAIGCVYNQTLSGEVKIGNSTVPITKAITLQAGISGPGPMLAAANGETLSHSPQPVPGGLVGLIECNKISEPVAKLACELVFENKLTGVNATTELVATPEWFAGNLYSASGVGVVLPLRVHLENALLGSGCYIGSASEPVKFELTTGTTSPPSPNEPITGSRGTAEIKDEGGFVIDTGAKVVDNSFSVPGATGCGGLLAPAIDAAIDLKLGLPSAAGNNTAILEGNLYEATKKLVKESGESAKEKEEREAREAREGREQEEREAREKEERELRELEELERIEKGV